MRRAKDVEAGGSSFVDPRAAAEAEPKARTKQSQLQPQASLQTRVLRALIAIAGCFVLGVHEVIFSAFTSVRCEPAVVRAGTNVTCEVRTGRLAGDADLSITQTGNAGRIVLLSESAHAYRVAFGTRVAGDAGVRVSHAIFWSSASVEVVAGPARRVDVLCAPPAGAQTVAAGLQVRCDVTPRDEHGNAADVVRPEGAPETYFAVSHVGGATQLQVHDTHVSFVAGGDAGSRCGIAVTLDGKRVESTVEVAPAAST